MNRFLLVILISMISLTGFSQQPDTLIKKLDSLSIKNDSTGKQLNNTTEAAYNEQTKITFRTYFILLGSTLKQEFTKPFHMSKKEWGQFGLFAVAAGGLAFADEPVQRQALKFSASNPGGVKASRYITNT